ncbi:EscU/YscU/HrcU family type III secretion system export apparatus switch protein [Alkaliphilus serpentinus]|uniref:Flagellar biogenesis protein n=1 Tax=Alkaliphilus serpentinus TaxID=1482731 RepID=A0A833HQL9_9FIRM|nr:EscU/YscU/HrcU family type III secretion system export apparatus switch protein [Alkaliphilus serpentinus]KAB3532058.1 flagellar biogenesis protein [Alkaliphilus serpentinus]
MEKRKLKQAVALKYNADKDPAPRITAAGKGVVAENIIKRAEENEIPLHQNDQLVKELISLRIGTEIPTQLYEIVAQVLAFVEGVDEKIGKTRE